MFSDILCLKDTGVQPKASTGLAQPFNWNSKRTFFWHKSPYVGFVAIRLTRKASQPDKKGLGEMYCWDIVLSVTRQIVEELVKAWPVLHWPGRRTNQWLMEQSKAMFKKIPILEQKLWNIVNVGSTCTLQQPAALTYSSAKHSKTVGCNFIMWGCPVWRFSYKADSEQEVCFCSCPHKRLKKVCNTFDVFTFWGELLPDDNWSGKLSSSSPWYFLYKH